LSALILIANEVAWRLWRLSSRRSLLKFRLRLDATSVDLKQSAIVTGNIATQRISIDEGACIKGNVNIQKEAPEKEVLGAIALSLK
jgi:hypothetical protein